MLNIEKYYDDIVKYKYRFAVYKNTGEMNNCSAVGCSKCIFGERVGLGTPCGSLQYEWLFKKYRESLLNDNEKSIIKALVEWCIATYEVDKSEIVVIAYDDGTIAIAKLLNDSCNMLIGLNHSSDDFKNLAEFRNYTLEELGVE